MMGERVGGSKDGPKTIKDCFGINDDFDILSRKTGDPSGSAKTWGELKRQLDNRPKVYQDVQGIDRILIRMGDNRIPDYSKSDLDYAHNFLSSLANLAKKDGHATAALMINHFLEGTGNSMTYSQKFLKQDQNYSDALTRNRSHIDKKVNEIAMGLGIGKSSLYKDHWDAMFTSSFNSELYYASGTSAITTNLNLKITRTGFFKYDVKGTIINYWHDRYNWEPGASAYIPGLGFVPDDFGLSLQEAKRGSSFLMHSTEKIKITEKNNFIMP